MGNPPLQPTRRVLEQMDNHGTKWAEVHADLSRPEVVHCMAGYDKRLQVDGESYTGFVEPAIKGGVVVWTLIGLRPRLRATEPAQLQVVGIETKRSHRNRRSGGSGGHWPSTWEELRHRVEASAGWSISKSARGGHYIVCRHGKQVTTLPGTASEYRGLLNACLQIKRAGLDVRKQPA